MPKHEPRNWYPVAGKAWPVLCKVAADRTVISYKELGDQIGEWRRSLRWMLGIIQEYCLNADLPPLTAVVVNKQSQTPGKGFIAWDVNDLESGLGYVYSKPWSELVNPFEGFGSEDTVETLATQLVEVPASAGDIYSKVRDRGIAQRIFREALIKAYKGRCAVCSLSFASALEAHHIIPFSECTPEQRIAVTNGILLCANHHKLFAIECFTVDRDLTISYYDPELDDGPYSHSDKQVSLAFHRKKLQIPEDPRLRPILGRRSDDVS